MASRTSRPKRSPSEASRPSPTPSDRSIVPDRTLASGLAACSFKREYRSGYDDLIRDFYRPALTNSRRYCRAVGYFSSSVFEAVGQPLGDFFASGGVFRLVTSVELHADDVEAIRRGIDRRKVCEERLLEQIRAEFVAPVGRGSRILAALIEAERMEIRIALPEKGTGIYHEKVGLFLESDAIYVAFSGSSNETRAALEENYECVDVYTAWAETERATAKRAHFERLWDGTERGVISFPFPEAARRELIRICNPDRPAPAAAARQDRWKHQTDAIAAFLAAKRGVLEMATGTGKTRTALQITEHLVAERAIDSVIVAADGTDLLDQWSKQLHALAATLSPPFRVHRHFGKHHERDEYELNPRAAILIVSRPALHSALRGMDSRELRRLLLVHDEVHRLGSAANAANLRGLSDPIPYRLGLSATPEREYDTDGTAFIEEHIGPVIYRFDLQQAIRAGILCEFDYHAIEFQPTREDREAKQAVFKQAAGRARKGAPMSPEEIAMALSRVDKLSRSKLPLFEDFLEERPDVLDRCIIFVEEKEYGEQVCEIIHAHRHDYHTYYADDDRSNLAAFAGGKVSCLVTCHRLSEGIDVRSIRTVVLFSSNRTRLETIQRIGRCLRSDPSNSNKRAVVVDFVKRDERDDSRDEASADQARKCWLEGLAATKCEVS